VLELSILSASVQERVVIIALEGALATGKSTVANHLASHHGAIAIEEVSKYFRRPDPEPYDWYFERQLDRLKIARRHAEQGNLVILAGDPFQPIWFNWIYPELGFAPWAYVLEFLEHQVSDKLLPHFYGFLTSSDEEMYHRQIARELTRGRTEAEARAKHDHYAKMVVPQRSFFLALGDEFPGFVQHVPPGEVAEMARSLLVHSFATPNTPQFFGFVRRWLSENDPSAF
jgi:hypothetical protein